MYCALDMLMTQPAYSSRVASLKSRRNNMLLVTSTVIARVQTPKNATHNDIGVSPLPCMANPKHSLNRSSAKGTMSIIYTITGSNSLRSVCILFLFNRVYVSLRLSSL